ncbi:hypothetical protein RU639_011707 [Aspergillus parasiticus]
MLREADGKKFRESDQQLALRWTSMYRRDGSNDNVKSFDGGRTPVERDIFTNVTANYDELVEVKASYEGGDWRARNRQEYRYIIGRRIAPRSQNDVIIGIARHTQGKNDFDAFFPF